jgi:hypothetical protein
MFLHITAVLLPHLLANRPTPAEDRYGGLHVTRVPGREECHNAQARRCSSQGLSDHDLNTAGKAHNISEHHAVNWALRGRPGASEVN